MLVNTTRPLVVANKQSPRSLRAMTSADRVRPQVPAVNRGQLRKKGTIVNRQDKQCQCLRNIQVSYLPSYIDKTHPNCCLTKCQLACCGNALESHLMHSWLNPSVPVPPPPLIRTVVTDFQSTELMEA